MTPSAAGGPGESNPPSARHTTASLVLSVLGALAVPVAALLGCVSLQGTEPDLERLYGVHAGAHRAPVIVIPGVFGSRLHDPESDREVWPGGSLDLIIGRRLRSLALSVAGASGESIGDRLEPGGFFFEAFGRDYYRTILHTLSGPGGYRCIPSSQLASEGADADCVLLSWDWRRDLVKAAADLDRVIQRLRALRGDPNLRVDIVAHSAGGLVARYYVRFGAADVLDRPDPEATLDPTSGRAIRRLILIGTPNYGSVSALQGAIMGSDVGLASMPPELLATMPSLFELFPNPNRTWMIDLHGQRVDVDLYDVETWRRYQWSIFDPTVRDRIRAQVSGPAAGEARLRDYERFFEKSLTRASRFHRALSTPLEDVVTEYVVFGGDCELTPARCLLEEVDGRVVIRLRPEDVRNRIPGVDYDVLMLEPGDGRVTKASLLARDSLSPDATQPGFFPIAYAVFICRGHAELPSDVTFRDNLLNILLY